MKRQPIIHTLKIVTPHFGYIRDGLKDFEICFDDRDFYVGDLLIIQEHSYNKKGKPVPTGESIERTIKHILRKFKGLMTGYIILGMEKNDE